MSGDVIPIFIVIMTALVSTAALLMNWMRGRQRIAELKARGDHRAGGGGEMELLTRENAGLRSKLGRLEERLAVLERIATDPAERTAREIESLR